MVGNYKTKDGVVISTNGANGQKVINEILKTMKRMKGWNSLFF